MFLSESIYGDWFGLAVFDMVFLCIFGSLVEFLFIFAVLPMAGWKSNFSFAILILVAICGIQQYIAIAICCLLSAFEDEMGLNKKILEFLYTFLPNLSFTSFIFIVLLNLCLSIHRFLFTVFPFEALGTCSKQVCKIFLIIVISSYYCFLFYIQFFLGETYTWDSSILFLGRMDRGYEKRHVLSWINRIGNYGLGCFNAVAYSLLFIFLIKMKLFNFKTNTELKFTMHSHVVLNFRVIFNQMFYVGITVILDIFFCIYYTNFAHRSETPLSIHIDALLTFACFLITIFPYLVINREIRENSWNILLCAQKARDKKKHSITVTCVRSLPQSV